MLLLVDKSTGLRQQLNRKIQILTQHKMHKFGYLLLATFISIHVCEAQFEITNLQTQNQIAPIGIDDKIPAFTWQMKGPADQFGINQSAYQIVVKDSKSAV